MNEEQIRREIEHLHDVLSVYRDTETTSDLYQLCRYLLDEIVERVGRLDAKASQFASFSGAILALLLSTYSTWRPHVGNRLLFVLAVLAVVCVALAGGFSFAAMAVTKFEWISHPGIVFPEELLDFHDQLRRHHGLAIYRSILSHENVSERKAARVIWCQNFFLAASILLALCLLGVLLKPWAVGLSGGFGDNLARRDL